MVNFRKSFLLLCKQHPSASVHQITNVLFQPPDGADELNILTAITRVQKKKTIQCGNICQNDWRSFTFRVSFGGFDQNNGRWTLFVEWHLNTMSRSIKYDSRDVLTLCFPIHVTHLLYMYVFRTLLMNAGAVLNFKLWVYTNTTHLTAVDWWIVRELLIFVVCRRKRETQSQGFGDDSRASSTGNITSRKMYHFTSHLNVFFPLSLFCSLFLSFIGAV